MSFSKFLMSDYGAASRTEASVMELISMCSRGQGALKVTRCTTNGLKKRPAVLRRSLRKRPHVFLCVDLWWYRNIRNVCSRFKHCVLMSPTADWDHFRPDRTRPGWNFCYKSLLAIPIIWWDDQAPSLSMSALWCIYCLLLMSGVRRIRWCV